MDNKTEDLKISPQHNSEYAEQWIAYLQKRHAVFSIVWPLLLILSVLLTVATLYFWQQEKLAQLAIEQALAEVSELNSRSEASLLREQNLEQQKTELMQEIESLKSLKKSLEEQQGESISQLDLTSQMVDTLKQQVEAMAAEKELMTNALGTTKEMMLQQEADKAKQLADLEAQYKATAQQLTERTVGYEAIVRRQKETLAEVDRLASNLNSKTADLNSISTELERMRGKLTEAERKREASEQKAAQIQQAYDKLERTMKQMVAPISEKDKLKSEPSATPGSTPKPASSSDGLDEIKVPAAR